MGRMDTLEQPRLPKNYQLLYEIVREAGHGVHLSAGEIFVRARKRRPGIGFSTVYRGIQRLRELGLIDEIFVSGESAAIYEPAAPSHAHFRCRRCGRIDDVDYRLPARLLGTLGKRLRRQIDDAALTFSGICESCSAERRVS
jgi:Fe2+ or Zn2+ uptake regulation protein